MKPKINPFWGFLTLALVLLTLALCFVGARTGVLLVKTDARPQDTVETFFESVEIGKYEEANACLENYGSLGLERSPRTEAGKLEWAALLSSFDYRLVGEPAVKRDTAVQTVELRYLDRNALELALTTPLEPEEGEETTPAGEDGETPEPRYPSLETLLEHPEDFYTTSELQITLHYVEGQWLIYADEALLTALSGGK